MLLIFDFDGTLCDTRHNILLTMKATIVELQLPTRTDAQCVATIGLPLTGCFRQLFPHADEDTILRCASTYRRIFAENLQHVEPKPFPHVVDGIRRLKQNGHTLTIASSRSHASLIELTELMGIGKCLDLCLGADDVEKAKPDPFPVIKTLSLTGFKAGNALVVGDMPVDVLMGKHAGTHTCGVTYGNSSEEQLRLAGADFLIQDFSQIFQIINLLSHKS